MTAGCWSRSSATTTSLDDGRIGNLRLLAGELHYHDQRFPIAPGTVGPDEDDPDAVHARQHYELVSWRRADSDLNYRRFFSVNTLAAIRVEDPEWFARSHEEIGRWFEEGLVDGLRIDHPDGLRDPGRYLDDLADLTGGAYVLVEKILEPGERLPDSWATAGTTGYDALALVDRVLTDPAGAVPLGELEDRLRGAPVDWHAMVHGTKRGIADATLLAETRRIARELGAHVERTPAELEDAVAELMACMPVYRSYLPEGRDHLDAAFAAARVAPAGPGCRAGRRRARARRRLGRRHPALPADQRDGDGQGRRGPGVLPLGPADLAQRGRRRPVGLLGDPRGVPRGDGRAAGGAPARDDRRLHPRHQARRGPPRPDHDAGRGAGRVGRRARPAARPRPAPRPRLRQPAVAGRPRCVDRRPRTARPAARVRREGDARGRRPHDVDRAGRRLRGGRARRRRRGLRRPGRRGGGRGGAWPRSTTRAGATRWPPS